jgi:arginine:ornithine antiporter/lysine permease
MNSQKKLSLGALVALVIGSMIGGGIFSLPQNVAASTGVGAALIGWVITAIGMLSLAFVFQSLANRKPDLNAGVYAYAKAGFGDYLGFSSAWGYWISAWIGNVSYMVLLFSTLGYFFPVFGEGNTLTSIVCASVLLWFIHYLILRGIKEALILNLITTIAKVIPIIAFILIVAVAFNYEIFTSDIWSVGNIELGSVMDQVRGMMLVTVWVFIGIEGASIYSSRAANRKDVGKATVIGFLGVWVILVLVNLLSMGIMNQPELAGLQNPSMAGVLEHVMGKTGAIIIGVGLIISLLGGLLAWSLLAAEILFVAAKDDTMPRILTHENKNQVPSNSLWISSAMIQVFLIITLFNESTYLNLLYLATSMILLPYLWSALYAVMLSVKGETYEGQSKERNKDMVISIIALIYSVWLVYAGGAQYILLSALLYAPGTIFFVKAKSERGETIFNTKEKYLLAVILLGSVIAIFGLFGGWLSI